MAFQSGAFQAGAFQGAGGNRLVAVEVGDDTFTGASATLSPAVLAAVEGSNDVFVGSSSTSTPATLTAREQGSDTFTGNGALVLLRARETGADKFSGLSNSAGQIIVIPRAPVGGTGYLVEMQSVHRVSGTARTFYFSTDAFNSLPSDTPANQHYKVRIMNPGNYSRSLFSPGTTSGDVSVGYGYIELVNMDGELDELRDYAFDGYSLRILTISRLRPVYVEASKLFDGTMEQVELSWESARVLIRDRLAELDKALQTALFAGTTIAGGMNEAEGQPDDLKGKPKPLCYGAPAQIVPSPANSFDLIYSAGADGLDAITEVRDKGVLLTASGNDYATIASLRTASIPSGQYATVKALGLFRLSSSPQGQVTCAPVKGLNAAARTAAKLARLVLLKAGFVENTHFLASDITALDALNPAEVGYYVEAEEVTTLDVVRKILGSIGAAIVPNRLGVFRLVRFAAPSGYPVLTLTDADLLTTGDQGQKAIDQLATGDEGKGVPAWKVSVKYRRNWSVMTNNDLASVNVTAPFRSFATEEWRTAVASDTGVKTKHKLSPELTFETFLVSEAAAQAEANRLLALHSVRRERFKVTVKSWMAAPLDLGSVVRLQINRFGLSLGRDFTVIGITENYQTGNTTLDLWG